MGRRQEGGQHGQPCQHDPSFRGPIQKRSCTDIICCVLFLVFIAGYMVVGILAWLYGDPRQVVYPRNSTGAYCGIGGNRDKPFVLYFDLLQCVPSIGALAAALDGLQCLTPQVCVSSCPETFWTVPVTAFTSPGQRPDQVWTAELKRLCQPGLNLTDTHLTAAEIIRRDLCPRYTIPSKPILNRCFPWFNSSDLGSFSLDGLSPNGTQEALAAGVRQIMTSLDARDISVKIFEDFAQSWYWILIGLVIAMALSLLFLLLLRFVAGILVWLLIIGVLGLGAYGIYHCWREYSTLRAAGASITSVGFSTDLSVYGSVKETWLAALILLGVVEGILLLLLIFLRTRIRIAIALLQEASRAIGYMMLSILYPLVTFVLLIICVAYWGMTALYLATSGTPLYRVTPNNASAPGCSAVSGNQSCDPLTFNASQWLPCVTGCTFLAYDTKGLLQRNLFNLQIYNVLGLLWVANFALALGQCVLAGAFASYYWARDKPRDIPPCAITAAFLRTLRYHVGSLAFGALILTIVQLIRIFLEYLDHKLKGAENPLTRCLLCCLKCCFWCLEKFIKFLNRNAYIMIAIYGKNFCVSAKNAFSLLMRNILRVVVLDKVTDLLLFFGKLLVVGGIGVLAFFFFSGRLPGAGSTPPALHYYWLPIITVVAGAYLISHGFFSVYNMCVDTLFLCFLEDLERNDGSVEKPYYMSKPLMKILHKKNKTKDKAKTKDKDKEKVKAKDKAKK